MLKPRPLCKQAAEITRHLTYSSVTRMNPFNDDERYTRFGDFVDSEDMKTPTKLPYKLPSKTYKAHGMPHSQSEGNIDFRSGCSSSSSGSQYSHIYSGLDDDRARWSEDTATSSTPSRGRSFKRTTSPTKELEDIKEVQSPVTPPPSPPKRSRSPMKMMFGEKGWLGKSMSMNELPSAEYRKTGLKHWGGKLKKGVGNLVRDSQSKVAQFIDLPQTENVAKIPRGIGDYSPSKSKSPQRSTFHVSLSPPMQAKLYSEMELMICATANQYLSTQAEEGRMSVESLQKITAYWESKNRPQVIEFMFDQATQRDLVYHNLKSFRFYGQNASNLVAMSVMMQAWKTLAREMSVRTFCTPDTAVQKHMRDTYQILEMLGTYSPSEFSPYQRHK